MSTYITKRLLQIIPVLILVSIVSFLVMTLMPGDPIDQLIMSDPDITTEDIAHLKSLYGLDQPFHVRYFKWVKRLLTKGDLGNSRTYKRPVTAILGKNIPKSLLLIGTSFIISLLIAIPIGVISAVKQYSVVDYLVTVFAFIGISMPSHWLGLLLIYLFAVILGWLPAGGIMSVDRPDSWIGQFLDRAKYLILPTISLCMMRMASLTRYMRSSMLEVIKEDYIRTARSKGLSEKIVIYKHALRNALIPIVTIVMLSIPFLFSGAIVTEAVFAYSGMGRLFLNAIHGKDTFLVMAITLLLGTLTLVCNFLADILYAVIDPRIRYS